MTRKGDGDPETETWPEADTSGGPSQGTTGGRYQDQPQSAKDFTKKERGMERVSDSDLVTNCGM